LHGTTAADTFRSELDWGYLRASGTSDYLNYVRYFDEVFADPGDTDIGNDLLDDRGATYLLDTIVRFVCYRKVNHRLEKVTLTAPDALKRNNS
jgi:hypothetical protein